MIASCFELMFSYEAEVKRAETQSRNLSHVLETQMEGNLAKIDLVMLELTRLIKKENLQSIHDEKEIREHFEARKRDLPEASTFNLIDKNGYQLFSSLNIKSKSLADREHFIYQKNAIKDELYISKPLISRVTQVPTIYLSRRITNKKNEFMGIVSTGIPLTYFRDIYSKIDVGSEGAITLFSNENILYSRFPWDPKAVGKPLKNQDIVKNLFEKQLSFYTTLRKSKIDKTSRLSSARRVGDTKFVVLVGISKDEVLADWKKRSTFYFVGFFILWFGGGLYFVNFLRSFQELEDRRKLAVHTAKLTSLGEMASGIAHEINNPLTIIATRSMQLKRRIERGEFDAEKFKESLLKINLTVDRIAKIIRGLKSFSGESDNDSFAPTLLSTIIENALELCSEKFRYKLVMIKIDPIPAVRVDCRESQMVQVILNLLSNAYDAVEALDSRWVHLSFLVEGDKKVRIVITDSGKGIPEKVAQSIMQPFFTTKEVGKGTGLGLSISKGIIEDHKGQFYLDKSADHTSFVIEIPLKSKQVQELEKMIS